jgi:hypothetical protein
MENKNIAIPTTGTKASENTFTGTVLIHQCHFGYSLVRVSKAIKTIKPSSINAESAIHARNVLV